MNFAVDDQKNFQGDINTLSTEDRVKLPINAIPMREK